MVEYQSTLRMAFFTQNGRFKSIVTIWKDDEREFEFEYAEEAFGHTRTYHRSDTPNVSCKGRFRLC
jgi:hypothetical protein